MLEWLPEPVNDKLFKTHQDFVNHLYSIFEADFKDRINPPIYNNRIVKYATQILKPHCDKILRQGLNCRNVNYNCCNCQYPEKEDIFNHVTCSELSKNPRIRTPGIYERQRAIRINWIRPIIENFTDENILYYEKPDKKMLSKCFWLKPENYLVVIKEDKKGRLFLSTGYFTYNKTSGIQKDYDNYMNTKKTSPK